MNKDMKAWVRELVENPDKRPMPILSFPAASRLGVTVRQLISDSVLQAEAMAMLADLPPTLAALGFMDLSVEAEAFGAQITSDENEVPTVKDALVVTQEEAEALQVPSVGAGRTGLYIASAKMAAERVSGKPVFAGCIGPFSLAGRLMGVENALVNCLDEPEMVEAVLERTAAFITGYVLAFKEAGADGVLLAEPLTGLLSPALAEEFSTPYVRRIVDAVQDESFIVIYHNCGPAVSKMGADLLETGASAFHFGNAVDLEQMLKVFPANVPVFGNLDPVLLVTGTYDSVFEAAGEMVARLGKYPNYVPSTGCDVPPQASWDNIEAFFRACHERFYKG